MLSRRSYMRHYYAHWTWSSHFNSSPARLLVTRDMRLFVTRDLTFWHFDWHFDMFESDDMTSARAVQVRQSLSKIERPPFISWLMTTGGRKFVYVITTYLLIEGVFAHWKTKLGFRLVKKKKLRGYSFFFKLSVKYQTKRSWLLFYFQAVIVLHLHKNYFVSSLFTILIIAIGHAW